MTWQEQYPQNPDLQVLNDLAQTTSLTQGLRNLGQTFDVSLLFLGEQTLDAANTSLFFINKPSIHDNQIFFCRDVYLRLNGEKVVWARSVCEPQSQFWREILNCGTRPLGEILFGGQWQLQRSPLQFSVDKNGLLLRRSSFVYQNESLYLIEHFLPSILNYLPKAA